VAGVIDNMEFIAHRRESDGKEQSLETHLLEVSVISKSLATKIGLPEQGELIGLLHDLGKYSKEFQDYLKSATGLIGQDEDDYVDAKGMRGKVDHSTAGAQLIWQELANQGRFGPIVGQMLALCIASHHSGLIDCLSSDTSSFGADRFTKRITKKDEFTHFQETKEKMDMSIEARFRELVNKPEFIDSVIKTLQKITEIEKLRGDEQIVRFKVGMLVRFLFSCLIDADRINSADFEKPHAAKARLHGKYDEWSHLISLLDNHLSSFVTKNPIDELRFNISQHCRDKAENNKGMALCDL
jgi:CRISPR-associated endonuclease/helicase Cas3